MKTFSKALVGTVAAAAVAVSSATPAVARDNRGGIDGGDIIAGALVIGGIAAIAAASSNNDRNSYDRIGYGGNDWRGRDGWNDGRFGRIDPRAAVAQCVQAAERNAGRVSYGRADVTDVRDVRNTRYGYEVRGRIAVNSRGRDWRDGDARYGRGWNNDYRGWNTSLRGYDSGSFKCRIERGRIVHLDYSGIRGL
ncbi:MAG: hypothetical protein B7X90_02230 [Novosphingobium sp. 17-62-19]|uniref:hypothetical protein n=1 Tax=Novosphingobium sp. 17-62-19 TaxID=1970406 RepID=UPI000BC58EEE|nr:hypothetical protein [Novosphingobium sp. 17-62-19]OYX93069.1 MAG: hypothetical protein B7Y74_10530 [Novosphingobium sp. 35-62-5]OZA21293.1 MAG: hypothetical protein B7X90_02230 [Novosphingobium sp. 17-62-19]OZA69913.1 MAG: hypothetical protein B7X78_03060 [Sphingomonadales bacterium 39-62-4]HQS98308.1 hypothetical protein [Novosphingobium sp.]